MIDRPLRICMLTTFYPPFSFGGDASYVQQMSSELAERGHHVEVVHCLDAYNLVANGEEPRKVKENPKVVVHRLKSKWGMLSPLATQQTGYPFFKRKAIREILAQGFDVIHYHNASLIGGPGLLEMGSAVKLYTAHEYWLVCPMHVLFRYDGVACEERRCLRCTVANGRPPQLWRYTNLVNDKVKLLDSILFPTKFSQTKHRELGLVAQSTHLPYFHKPQAPLAHAPRSADESPFFLYVGRLEPLKGVHTLIPIFQKRPHTRLVIVGDGSQMHSLKALAGESKNIEFLGWRDHASLSELYRKATALLVPSLCFEGGPLVVLEAAAHHTPAIGHRIGAIPELIEALNGGLLYTDEASLGKAMDLMLEAPALRDEFGENAFAEYQRAYSAEMHLTRYFEIIEQAWANRKRTI